MQEPQITPELVQEHNLTPEEYEKILEILGREPNYTELGIFSVMWSEHCSYKNTRPLLKGFPTKSSKVLVGAGEENAGVLDIGDGIAISFKIESHNHPSAVEPFQGATTGVGGILRDIFTMGARPVAAMNSLRFGEITNPEVRRLFRGVVGGIGHYGNCFGIPTVGGEVYFDKSYEGNPLVNAFCLGVLRHDQIARGAAKGIGNPVFYVGPATGRDGLAGAAFASQDLTEESQEQQRGAVQVGDPFMEKLVCEACLELLDTGAVTGIQDMGAAGLTCSTCETAARGGTGIELDLDKVPQRGPDMTSYELMLSESQERMLIIVEKGREDEVKRIFDKWDLPWAQVGVVTDTGQMVVKHKGEIVADMPAAKLADDAPVYHREAKEPEYMKAVRAFTLAGVPDVEDVAGALSKLLSWPTIASKNWVYSQYDFMVRNGTAVIPGSDAAVIRIKSDSIPKLKGEEDRDTPEKLLAMTTDCNGTYVYLDPYVGGKIAVAEAARNLACSGALPIGSTDNLNFGNPHNPELFYQLREAVKGLAEGCSAFRAPVTGGNVSLYNQNPEGAIDPTPTMSMVGLIDKEADITTQWFKDEGDAIILLGVPVDSEDAIQGLGGSSYLQLLHDTKSGTPPRCELEDATTLNTTLLGLIQAGGIKSAHDCAEGGLAVAIAESCISNNPARETPRLIGAEIDLSEFLKAESDAVEEPETSDGEGEVEAATVAPAPRLDALLFGETQHRVVVSCAHQDTAKIAERAELMGVPAARIGTVGGEKLSIVTGDNETSWALSDLHDGWWNSIARAME
ncbi:MAG: phosphoribosylformylglycinamidine synthase subunit PurL [Verrucomicrobiia bacterium]|jgi:phosphoribosylformylglycinamidine synthase II